MEKKKEEGEKIESSGADEGVREREILAQKIMHDIIANGAASIEPIEDYMYDYRIYKHNNSKKKKKFPC